MSPQPIGLTYAASHFCDEHVLAQAYLKAVELLIELASLQTAFLTLDEAIKTTNRRVNALDNVVRPRLENTIAYIKVSCAIPWVASLSWPDLRGCSAFDREA